MNIFAQWVPGHSKWSTTLLFHVGHACPIQYMYAQFRQQIVVASCRGSCD